MFMDFLSVTSAPATFKKQIRRYPDPYVATLRPSPSSSYSSFFQNNQLPFQQSINANNYPHQQQRAPPTKVQQQNGDVNQYDDSVVAADGPFDGQQNEIEPQNIMAILNQVKTKLQEETEEPPKRKGQQNRLLQIQPEDELANEIDEVISSPLNRFSGRQVGVEGFPNGLPASTPEGVKIALLSSQNGPNGEMGPIPGQPGVDFPVLESVPDTGFQCGAEPFAGIYGDVDADCQVFHMCQPNGNVDSFLCPNGTIFNQQYFVCDWWYNVDCAASPNFYALNEFIYKDNEEEETV